MMNSDFFEPMYALLEAVALGVIVVDAQGHLIRISPMLETMFGYPLGEVQGQPFNVLLPNVQHTALALALQPVELQSRHKDGRQFAIRASVRQFEIGGETVSVVVVNDTIWPKEFEAEQQTTTLTPSQMLAEYSNDILLFARPDGQIVEANRAAVVAYGYDHATLLTKNIADLRDPTTLGNLRDTIKQVISGAVLYETRHRRSDGTTFPVEVNARAATLDGEHFVGGVIRDITERNRAEVALRLSEERFRATFEQAAVGIAHVAITGQFLQVNERLCAMSGYTSEELLVRSFQDLIVLDYVNDAQTNLRQLLTNEQARYTAERPYQRKDGTVIWLNVTVSLVRDAIGAPTYFVVVAEDISEHKHTETTHALLAAIVDASDDAIIGVALNETIMSWNIGAERMYGYTAAEVIGKPIEMLCPPDVQDTIDTVYERLRGGESNVQCATARAHKDGHIIDVMIALSPIKDARGETIGFSTITRDITEYKQAEALLQRQTTLIQLLQAVAAAANQASSVEEAMQTAINQICVCMGWPIGHVLMCDQSDPERLVSMGIWYVAPPDGFAAFRAFTEEIVFAQNSELPGWVLAHATPRLIPDLNAQTELARTHIFCENGIRSGVAFPVLLGSEVVAVLEFFAREPQQLDAALLDVMANVGKQLGHVVARVRAEAALRASEERYRLITENIADVILLANHQERIIYASPSFQSVLGYDPADIVRTGVFERTHPNDVAQTHIVWAHILAEGSANGLLRYQAANGDWRWFEVHGTATTQDGQPIVVVVGHDVTERRRAEQALRAAETRYRTLVEQLPAIIYTAKANSRSSTSYVSPQIEAILGFTPEEWLADDELWLRQVHPDDQARLLADVAHTPGAATSTPTEYRSFTRDGQIVWLQDTSRTVFNEVGHPLFLQGITLDITERKQAEEALQRSQQLYRALAHNFPNGAVFLFDHDLRYIIADGSSLADMGLERNALEGHTIWEVLSPEIVPAAEALFREVLAGISSVQEDTWQDRIYLFHRLPVKDQHGHTVAGMITAEDITVRKQVEQALVEERTLLTWRVEARTADLSAANAELARAARLKDEFLASMSHELRTPLNAVLGLSEVLREQAYGPVNDKQDHALQTIEESGRHLLELINDILDLAKIGAGKLELDIEPTNVEHMCQSSLRIVRQAAQKKQLSVKLAIDPAATYVQADARRLKQILVNLLANAVKFTPGGGTIGLQVTIDAEQQAIQFIVWDTGIGIAPDQMERLFQPFVQLDSRLARKYQGTGLGLALVYRMTELHGGSVAVTSQPHTGSRFSVSLPWQAEMPFLQSTPPTNQRQAGSARKLQRALIIQDSPTSAEQLTRYLVELNITVDVLVVGAQAVARAQETQPDLILLDILLPDISGWNVLAQLKADPRTRAIPVVIVSVIDEQPVGIEFRAAAYLVKPCTRAELQRTLQRLFGSVDGVPEAASDVAGIQPLILLAEDNEANIMTVTDYLTVVGYQVVAVRNGAEAVTRAHELRPALILMDVQMPGMDGLEATRRIRADAEVATVPIIAMTALAMPGDFERCIAAGANAYLSKPISLKVLAATIANHLRNLDD